MEEVEDGFDEVKKAFLEETKKVTSKTVAAPGDTDNFVHVPADRPPSYKAATEASSTLNLQEEPLINGTVNTEDDRGEIASIDRPLNEHQEDMVKFRRTYAFKDSKVAEFLRNWQDTWATWCIDCLCALQFCKIEWYDDGLQADISIPTDILIQYEVDDDINSLDEDLDQCLQSIKSLDQMGIVGAKKVLDKAEAGFDEVKNAFLQKAKKELSQKKTQMEA